MSGHHTINSLRLAWCALVIAGFASCGASDLSAGTPYPGAPGKNLCSTGTQVALVEPAPGSSIAPRQTAIKIASSLIISKADAALVLRTSKGSNTPPRPLIGPIHKPKGVPSPFPSPVFYEALFNLKPSRTYLVEISSTEMNCTPNVIQGATFKTTR